MRAVVLALLPACVAAAVTLAVVDPQSPEKYSEFFDSLRGVLNDPSPQNADVAAVRGHQLTVMSAEDPGLKLARHGEFLFDNLILFCPGVEEFGGAVDANSILEFVDSGRNLLLTASNELGDPIREVASESGVIFSMESDFVAASNFEQYPTILGPNQLQPVLFEGIGMQFDPENRLVFKLLSGSASAYSGPPEISITADTAGRSGRSTILMAALQARNNARIVFSGSNMIFSNDFLSRSVSPSAGSSPSSVSGNDKLGHQVSMWCFGERGKLRWSEISYGNTGETRLGDKRSEFTVSDPIEFWIRIEQWDGVGRDWVPYVTDDVQLEIRMLDPWVRANMTSDSTGLYKVQTQLPDQFGVFQLRIDYQRRGYSWIRVSEQVSVRPLRHNQHQRFLLANFPYYASSYAVMAGTLVFSAMLLYFKPDPAKSAL
eukprot:TRINITY_DN19427_c0_g1_i1.p1 TRINITY_DN19427_c0_g1~~TRINITY_DN19427_c0_g1_i1.p1  ORF type:complete len:431 (+),score=76.52 TRINITY_DN19427_c0_g1_i1:35-1327(+)